MPGDASLPANHDTLTDSNAPRDSGLPGNDGIFADDNVVRHLDQVVDLCALLDPRPPKSCSINRCISPDFDVVIDLNDADLWHFFILTFGRLESKTISSN